MNLLRKIEKTKKFGYLFCIAYDGTKFDCFDENPNRNSVKKYFSDTLKTLDISWAKGVQQAGRTDAKVSAKCNYLYISTWFNGDYQELAENFNKISNGITINKIIKTVPDIVLPEEVEKRVYSYIIPKKYNIDDLIEKRAAELSGTYNLSEFTDSKGKLLKKLVRDVSISVVDGKLIFEASSFLPKQIRIMSSYILTGKKEIFPPEPLTLENIIFKESFQRNFIFPTNNLHIDYVLKSETLDDILLIYADSQNKLKLIGKNGKNIKALRKKYGKVVVKDV